MRPGPVDVHLQLDALFEEYRVLYSLVTFRMTALDRRVPVTAGAMTAVLAGLDVVSTDSQLILLLALPLALIWFVRATINHARSFEDVLRRIDQIEEQVNSLLTGSLLRFQSHHPSRARHVGGRTSRETVSAVVAASLLLLAVAAFRMVRAALLPVAFQTVYLLALSAIAVLLLRLADRLAGYRYDPTARLVTPSLAAHF